MKATIEIPDTLFRRVKSKAAERGLTLKEFVAQALHEKLAATEKDCLGEPEWMQGFGKLRRLHKETLRIQSRIDGAFEVVEPESSSVLYTDLENKTW